MSAPAVFELGTAEKPFTVEVFDCCEDHVKLLASVFDFEAIKALLRGWDFSWCMTR